jgi:hypothetical protein
MLGVDPTVRPPAVAGRFYPADEGQCRAEAKTYLYLQSPASEKKWIGGLVPHAGWVCSGAVAGQAIATIAAQGNVDVVIIFGAVHTPIQCNAAALDSHPRWAMPAGQAVLAGDLQKKLEQKGTLFAVDARMHAQEHAVEVVVPMIQEAFPNTPILPIEVPAMDVAELIGRKTVQCVAEAGLRAVYLASSDLTHYGPNYRFTPAGVGPAAMEWTKDNDRHLLRLITELAADRVVSEVHHRYNACGAGAITAMLAACRACGATLAKTLWHTNSYETLAKVAPQPPHNAVGYAAVVVG